MFPQVNPLPGAERHAPVTHRQAQLSLGQHGPHVRGHVVGSFQGVPVRRIAIGPEARDDRFQVPVNIGVRILGDQQRGAGVSQEEV